METRPYVSYLPRYRPRSSNTLRGQLLPWGDPYICQLQRQHLEGHEPHAEIALPVFPVTTVPDVSHGRQRSWPRGASSRVRSTGRPAAAPWAEAV